MLRVLGKASSGNVRKVPWTCREIGLDRVREDRGSGFAATDLNASRRYPFRAPVRRDPASASTAGTAFPDGAFPDGA